ncbi:Aminopeptidase Q [Formica fusca]
MRQDARDFLQTWYTKEEKDNGFIFATLIQPKRTQQLFPCWDEPSLKATFNISVEHHTKYKVLSNMPIREYKSVNDSAYTMFQTTPAMSTYKVAIILSDLDQVLNSTETVVNTWCRPHLKPHMTFAQYVAGNVTEYLENNFKILKKVPKMDYIAIPSLEDRIRQTWGLVFYR